MKYHFYILGMLSWLCIQCGTSQNEDNTTSEKEFVLVDTIPIPVKELTWLVKPQYEWIMEFHQGLAAAKKFDGKAGFINKHGETKSPFQYEEALWFSEGLAGVKLDGKWGFVDTTGKMVIKPQFGYVYFFSEGVAAVGVGEPVMIADGLKWGYINKKGEWIIKPQFESGGKFQDGIAVVSIAKETHNEYTYITKQGEIKPFSKKYDFGKQFFEGLAIAKVNERVGYINKKGKWIIKPTWYEASDFVEGLAYVRVYIDGKPKYGFINQQGKWVIPPKFDWARGSFHEGLAPVEVNKKVGYINKKGEWVINPQFKWASGFHEGVAVANLNGKVGLLQHPFIMDGK